MAIQVGGVTVIDNDRSLSNITINLVTSTSLLALSAATSLTASTNGTERLRIHGSGGVSIGNTTDPGLSNLSVNGSISADSASLATALPATSGGTGKTTLPASQAALTGWLDIVSSGGTYTLTNASPETISVSGTSGHTIVLPDVTALDLGWSFVILNRSSSTGGVVVRSSGLVVMTPSTIAAGHAVRYTCVATTGTTPASWQVTVIGSTARTGTGSSVFNTFAVLNTPTLSNATFTGTVTADGSVGSAGQVLSSTGTGVTWTTPSSSISEVLVATSPFIENGQTVTTNYTVTAGRNAMSAGPIAINPGITVTVPDGSVWLVL